MVAELGKRGRQLSAALLRQKLSGHQHPAAVGAEHGAPAAGDTAITPESAAVFLDQTLERWRKLGVVA